MRYKNKPFWYTKRTCKHPWKWSDGKQARCALCNAKIPPPDIKITPEHSTTTAAKLARGRYYDLKRKGLCIDCGEEKVGMYVRCKNCRNKKKTIREKKNALATDGRLANSVQQSR